MQMVTVPFPTTCSLFFFFFFFFSFETGSYFIAQAGLELAICLLQPPKSWAYRHVPPYLALFPALSFKEGVCSFSPCVLSLRPPLHLKNSRWQ
jgi:hypothetical protein